MEDLTIFSLRFALLIFGLLGNLVGIILLRRKKLLKLATNQIYLSLFIMDSIYLISQVFQDTADSLGLDLRIISDLSCKIYSFWNFAFGPVSSFLLIYISIERFIAIKYKSIK